MFQVRAGIVQRKLKRFGLSFLRVPGKPASPAIPFPVLAVHAGLLPSVDPRRVQLRVEQVPSFQVPPLPADKAVAERRTTARRCYVVCAHHRGICVCLLLLAHPQRSTHHRPFVFSHILCESRANACMGRSAMHQMAAGPAISRGWKTN